MIAASIVNKIRKKGRIMYAKFTSIDTKSRESSIPLQDYFELNYHSGTEGNAKAKQYNRDHQ